MKEMRVFDKNARDELRNAIKHKETEYIQNYAKIQMATNSTQSSSRNYSIVTQKTGGLLESSSMISKKTSNKYSFPQDSRRLNIKSVSQTKKGKRVHVVRLSISEGMAEVLLLILILFLFH
jgi:hypothetical protein